MDVPQRPVINPCLPQVIHRTGRVRLVARVATDVGVQQPDGEPGGSHIAKAECKIVPNVALRIADAVDDGASRVLGEYGHALPLPAEPVAQDRIGQPRLPAVERVVISVTDKRTDALLVQPLQPLDELPLGTQAALRAVVHVAGDKQRVYPFTDAQVDDVVVRPERRIGYLARDALRRGVAQPLEGAVEVQVGGVDESEQRHRSKCSSQRRCLQA